MTLRARHLSAGLAFLLSSTMLCNIAHAQNAAPAADDETMVVTVIGKGKTRSVSTLTPADLDVLPPGTSAQKALNFLPGVSAHAIDALGVNEQSMSLQVRGFSTTHLGYTLDGVPLGDGAYNNYNGLSISRALISDNLAQAELATGIAGLSIPSTSNLGGAVLYTSSDPRNQFGFRVSQTFGSENAVRSFVRVDTGVHNGFSAYVSAQYSEQDVFSNQAAYNTSFGQQLNAKAQYEFSRGKVTAYANLSATNQANNTYLSKDSLSRLGWDWGAYAPDWQSYLDRNYCSVTGPAAAGKCVPATAPEKNGDVTFTNGQILRNDDFYYVAGEFDVTPSVKVDLKAYTHSNKGAGNNFITGWSTQGTASTDDDVPVRIRDTRYTIDRQGVLGNIGWKTGIHHIQAGFWFEDNTSSAVRYLWTNVTGPMSLAHYLYGQPNSAQWAQETDWKTEQFYIQDSISLLDDTLNIDFGFKSTNATSSARAIPGIAKSAPPASSQFATGKLTAKDTFLPEAGVRWAFKPGHEVYASYAENMAMFQGGFKLGPQSVSQEVWDAQGKYIKPETSKTIDLGYRYISRTLQVSVAVYDVEFENRLLQYNPCPTNQQQNPGCGNSFHNAGSVSSRGLEVGVLWRPMSWLTWYNSASFNESVYNEDLNWCTTTCEVKKTKGKQQVDTPKQMFTSVVSFKHGGWYGSLSGKYTGERFYTYTNDQGFGGVTTFDMGLGYKFADESVLRGAKLSLNVTNLTDKRHASNFDNSVFAPDDANGTIKVFHASAPRQAFVTLGYSF